MTRPTIPWRFLLLLIAANLSLLLPSAHPLRVTGALLLIGFLPGLGWVQRVLPTTFRHSLWSSGQAPLPLRWVMAAALSFIITLIATLLLHYLPGPLQSWQLLLALNFIALLPLIPYKIPPAPQHPSTPAPPLLIILPIILLLIAPRITNLGYSEFQGDEALAMISAAEALEGHEDALFLRSKGPGEVLLPMALWRLTGTINEPLARLPFTLAGLLVIATIYLIGETLDKSPRSPGGWSAAIFVAMNGFTVAFSRIVQYQALVLWFSSLAFLLMIQWRQTKQARFAFLSGLCLGAGLLAHYDAILVLPAIGWLYLADVLPLLVPRGEDSKVSPANPSLTGQPPSNSPQMGENRPTSPLAGRTEGGLAGGIKGGLLFVFAALFIALPFYLPFSLDPQANRTGDYVGGRIGSELRNNLPDFFHFNTFYSSFYYILFTGLLVFGLLLWLAGRGPSTGSGRALTTWGVSQGRARWNRGWIAGLLGLATLAVVFQPDLLALEPINLAALPFALLLAGAFFALSRHPNSTTLQAVIAWLAVPFLGYNFVVALGLTHIYTIVPAWSLLAALAWGQIELLITNYQLPITNYQLPITKLVLPAIFLLLSTAFLWNAFVRHDIEYWQDYPAGTLAFFWGPYDEPPAAGFFGFAHRAGWKTVGQKIVSGQLSGDYGSNEEPDVTTWYTRGAPRACDSLPEYYFLADDLIDPVEVPGEVIDSNYQPVGRVILPNGKQLRIMQQRPVTLEMGDLDDETLARAFDQSATPAAFARSARGAVEIEANFGNLVQLIGYDLDTRRAYPGGRVPVTLYWQALAPVPTSYQVFTHLESEAAGLVAQADGVPVCWSYPTNLWRPGQIIADQHAITIPAEAPPGDYPLQIGLYRPDTFERLDLLDEAGNPAGTSLTLTSVEIGD